ncbi:MAG: PEP-CTERM sorting domain-containing protein [Leptolyngbya sp. SIO1E4]|nr:PEP-CTERM sorting domain-containing protein [Leptolyngbya sp. SIO1E4]
MIRRTLVMTAASAVAVGVGLTSSAEAASLVLDLEPGGAPLPCSVNCGDVNGRTFGWAFDVSDTITVDGLGLWDFGADGIGPDVQVGLWQDDGSLLASTSITNASLTEASNNPGGVWLFEDIAAQTLTAGRYVIGATFFSDTPLFQIGAPTTTIPEVTVVGGRFDDSGLDSGLAFPGNNAPPLYGPTLRLGDTPVAVPEPTAVLGLLALAGAGMTLKRKTA